MHGSVDKFERTRLVGGSDQNKQRSEHQLEYLSELCTKCRLTGTRKSFRDQQSRRFSLPMSRQGKFRRRAWMRDPKFSVVGSAQWMLRYQRREGRLFEPHSPSIPRRDGLAYGYPKNFDDLPCSRCPPVCFSFRFNREYVRRYALPWGCGWRLSLPHMPL